MKPKLISWKTSPWSDGRVGELGEEALLQLPKRQVGGVDHYVRVGPNGIETAALLRDRSGDSAAAGQRMAVSSLRETADQDVVASLEEDHARLDAAALEGTAHRGQGQWRVAGADIQHDGDLLESVAIRRDQLRQIGQQLTGHVVHAGVAEVFEQLRRRGLARPR